ncbi:MAG: hypothetical protein AB2810_19440 [Candidatus Thiodiazotropha endolucinida]
MELLTLVLEKGLLGLVLLGLGAYFAHRLERYKASNAYFNALSTQKLKAYEEVSELIGKQVSRTQVFLHKIVNPLSANSAKNRDSANELVLAYNNLRNNYEEEAPRLVACSLYFTKELEELITKHLGYFHGVFLEFSNGPENSEKVVQELERLMKSAMDVQEKLRKEVNANPFK